MPINQQEFQQFSRLELLAKQAVEGFITGLHKSPFHGFSVEFSEYRPYNSGDSTRHIDWRLYGKTDKLFVKRYEEETNLRCLLVLDHSSSMYYPISSQKEGQESKLSFSVKAAAALVYLLKQQRDATGLSIFADELELQTPSRSSPTHISMLYSELEKLLDTPWDKNKKTTAVAQSLHTIAEAIHKRSLVIIFSDMFEEGDENEDFFSALQHLKHNKHEVIMFHVTDKQKEIDFNFDNRPYKFVDLETGEEIKIQPSEIKEFYVKKLKDLTEKVKVKCAQFKIDYVEADINNNFKQILLPFLIKRSRMSI